MTEKAKLQIDLVGADALLAPLARGLALLEHPQDMLDAIGAELEANINLRFATKADAGRHAWPALAPATVEIYKRKYGGSIPGSLLERTRHMRNTLAHNAGDDFVEVGFSAPYAGWHVTGTKHMPRRDPIFASVNEQGTQGEMGAQDKADVLAVIESFLSGAVG